MTWLLGTCRSTYRWFRFGFDKGVTAIEYALLVMLIAALIVTAARMAGANLHGIFTQISKSMPASSGSSGDDKDSHSGDSGTDR